MTVDLYLSKIREEPEPLNTNQWGLFLRRALFMIQKCRVLKQRKKWGERSETTERELGPL